MQHNLWNLGHSSLHFLPIERLEEAPNEYSRAAVRCFSFKLYEVSLHGNGGLLHSMILIDASQPMTLYLCSLLLTDMYVRPKVASNSSETRASIELLPASISYTIGAFGSPKWLLIAAAIISVEFQGAHCPNSRLTRCLRRFNGGTWRMDRAPTDLLDCCQAMPWNKS